MFIAEIQYPRGFLDFTIVFLKAHKEIQKANKKKLEKIYVNSNLVCSWPDGRPFDPDYVTKAFGKLLAEIKMPHIRFHDLRHTHATLLLKMRENPRIVAERLGDTVKTTMEVTRT